jgi:hypothetical protein
MKSSDRATAFRLVNELEGLIAGMSADGVIVPAEADRLKRWLAEAEPFRNLEPFSGIAHHLDAALVDGVLTVEECEDLSFVACQLSAHNPYFDHLRTGVQQLMGLLTGVTADARVLPIEAARLHQWAIDWRHLAGLWPYDECHAVVHGLVADPTWTEGRERLIALAGQFPIAGHVDPSTGELPPVLIGAVCAVSPSIEFPDRRFVFTGASATTEREELSALVSARGGVPQKNVTKTTDYLVVCDEGSQYWAFACYGRKVEQAYKLRMTGLPITLVREPDFWSAIR